MEIRINEYIILIGVSISHDVDVSLSKDNDIWQKKFDYKISTESGELYTIGFFHVLPTNQVVKAPHFPPILYQALEQMGIDVIDKC